MAGVAPPTAGAGSDASGKTATGGAASAEGGFKSFTEELKAGASGVWHSDFREEQKKEAIERFTKAQEEGGNVSADQSGDAELEPPPRPTEDEEERLRAKAMMPKRHKRLLQRIEKSARKKTDSNERLKKKRRQLETPGSTA